MENEGVAEKEGERASAFADNAMCSQEMTRCHVMSRSDVITDGWI